MGESRCYAAVCPEPLQVTLQFWGRLDPACDHRCADADRTGDGVIDTRDFTCFFNAWIGREPAGDCDGNGVWNTQDFICFLNIWSACRG